MVSIKSELWLDISNRYHSIGYERRILQFVFFLKILLPIYVNINLKKIKPKNEFFIPYSLCPCADMPISYSDMSSLAK